MVEEKIKRKRGGQLGNQNARTHGYYSPVLSRAQQEILAAGPALSGLDKDIAIARLKLLTVANVAPDNQELILLAMAAVNRLESRKQHQTDDEARLVSQTVDWVFNGPKLENMETNQA